MGYFPLEIHSCYMSTKTTTKKGKKSNDTVEHKASSKSTNMNDLKPQTMDHAESMEQKPMMPKAKKTGDKPVKQRSFFSKLLSSLVGERKELRRYEVVVNKILELDEPTQALTDDQLKAKTIEFKNRLKGIKNKEEKEKRLKEILPEAFAVVREAAFRVIGQKHYPVQLIGGIVQHEGRISEMKTGEGKTLVSTLAGYLNALPEDNQVHLVTVNDYLARRDASWMGQIYNFLGLTVGVIQNQSSFYFKYGAQADAVSEKRRDSGIVETFEDGEQQDKRAVLDVEHLVTCERKRAYWDDENNLAVDVVYGVNSEFGFDYLRDNMATSPKEISQRAGHTVAIVDEVDSILIDEARTPLIIRSIG